ncbi:hypothetical protein PAXRUDRAFT_18604 [Paxillus rubicundulus Ve08.2h10]|uniref:Uncharacterized protein n=1 Tax=Paxillus rubicundulus Ve08.2h10 TaxID=930991 RepID=A0A0D0CKY1_9AGAM|nr:hypothetical protein PAXRUDRAFT_18604 [Paxillus rubicundulus Ve08.2h10]
MCWQYSGSNSKSAAELNRLWSFIQDSKFDPTLHTSFSHDSERKLIEKYLQDDSNPFKADHGWRTSSVPILLPKEKRKWKSEFDPAIPVLTVDGVHHRDIIDIITSVFEDPISSTFHMTPFEQYWKISETRTVQVFGEAFSSPTCLNAYQEVNSLPREQGDDLERVVAPLMLWSDATHLANFGDASLWPVYLFFGNQSKYTRGKPTAAACHHVAYIPTLPDNFQDIYVGFFEEGSSDDVYRHCKRELMQAIWKLLLDEKFMHAYKYGIVIRCGDGITRRVFPRFFSYSADYPEKILLACIKFLGACPCPRCLVKKADIPKMGMKSDLKTREKMARVDVDERRKKISQARKYIFKHGVGIDSQGVKEILYSESLVPTHNAFSDRFAEHAFNYFCLFVVDLLHELELGVWKAVFTHLMRILFAHGGTSVQALNWRYRKVSTFGRGTIRRFHKNASAMKRLAARDFEDLLQCALPVFEGLLPAPHNKIVLDLLFDFATWHAYAKLRLHTEDTLAFFDKATITLKLPQEHAVRGRRKAALAAKQGRAVPVSQPKHKTLNLTTYKYHALADYPSTIRQYGTTDSYSTQLGELEHRRSKRRFPRSGKKKGGMVRSIANQEAIERFIRKVNDSREKFTLQNEPVPRRLRDSPSEHYHIAKSSRKSEDITAWLVERSGDPAFEDFLPGLQAHILGRVRGLAYDGDEHIFSEEDRRCISINDNKIYWHSMLRVNYTTYDVRREQDTINPLTHADIMVLSHEDERTHPYWYARIVHIFHVMVRSRENSYLPFSSPTRMNVLFVRWFRRDVNYPSGWMEKRPHRLQFFDQENPADAFGFVDPDLVVRGVHIIPAFAYARTEELLGPSKARRQKDGEQWDADWKYYYINMFVDRDMFMRFRGGGVGHKATRDWDDILQSKNGDSETRDPKEEDVMMGGSEVDSEEGESESEEEDLEEGEEAEDSEFEDVVDSEDDDGDDRGNNNGDDNDSDGSNDDEDGNMDRVVPDEGEELDDDIYAREGYGAL